MFSLVKHQQESFILYLETDAIYNNIAKDFETRFDTSNHELDRPFLKEKNKRLIGYELGGKIMKKCVRLGTKTYSYLIDDSRVKTKKNKRNKKVRHKKINLKIIKTV